MNRLETILVDVDFSECSRCALEQAVRLARWNDAGLRIIHVMPPPSLNSSDETLQQTLNGLRGRMREDAIARLADWAGEAGAPAGHSLREMMPQAVGGQEIRRGDCHVLPGGEIPP